MRHNIIIALQMKPHQLGKKLIVNHCKKNKNTVRKKSEEQADAFNS